MTLLDNKCKGLAVRLTKNKWLHKRKKKRGSLKGNHKATITLGSLKIEQIIYNK